MGTPDFVGVNAAMANLNLVLGTLCWAGRGLAALYVRLKEKPEGVMVSTKLAPIPRMIRAAGYAESTALKYAACVERFVTWSDDPLHVPSPQDVRAFLEHLRLQGLGRATRRLHLAALRTVFDKLLGEACTAGVRYPPKPEPRPPAKPADVEALLQNAMSPSEKRLMALLHVDGLRLGQVAGLDRDDVREAARGLPSVPNAVPELLAQSGGDTSPAFPGRDPRCPVTPRALHDMFKRVAARAGRERLSTTSLRKAPIHPELP